MKTFLVLLSLILAPAAFACSGEPCANGLGYAAFGPAKAKTLAVFVHGDVSSGGAADYMYRHAQSFAANNPNVVAIALLRPGYYDSKGLTSAGNDAGRRGDGYSSANVSAVAGAISALKRKYGATRAIALGHSGGAALVGIIAGKGGLNGAVLTSCPCDVPKWWANRGRRGAPQSLSPIDYAKGSAPIALVVGSSDDNTTPDLSHDFAAKAKRGNVRVEVVSGGHNFGGSLASTSVEALSAMVR